MSLRPDDRSGRRERSRTRDRSRSRDNRDSARAQSPPRSKPSSKSKSAEKEKSKKSARFAADSDDDDDDNDSESDGQLPSRRHVPGGFDDQDRRPSKKHVPGTFEDDDDHDDHLAYGAPARSSGKKFPGLSSLLSGRQDSDSGSESDAPPRKPSSAQARQFNAEIRSPREAHMPSMPSWDDPPRPPRATRHESYIGFGHDRPGANEYRPPPPGAVPYPEADHSMMPHWPQQYNGDAARFPGYHPSASHQYPESHDKTSFGEESHGHSKSRAEFVEPPARSRPSRSVSYSQESHHPPETKATAEKSSKSNRLSSGGLGSDLHAPATSSGRRPSRLSVSGNRPDVHAAGPGKPPGSPLLEAYHGTYQSISPMPSPMMLPAGEDDVPNLSPLSMDEDEEDSDRELSLSRKTSKLEAKGSKVKKRVKLYDAEGDAEKLAKALNHHEARPQPLIDILPELTHDQLLALRDEYKKRVKVQGRGVNISKQIKAGTTGNFGKICYVTSLGRWESESYWANFWYQSRSSNRELLIEALMGRTNADMREIKDSFKDKRYNDSLSRCMEKELKPDKFRTAVLMALDERRQEETDIYSTDVQNKDVETLHRALKARDGGETAILDIVITRSDNHLRRVLSTYEFAYEENFARAALKKSNNLVGEVIAHILNGAINRPARDSLLLRHAVQDVSSHNTEVDLRYELLMSRLIRLHWDKTHLARVKAEYQKKYRKEVERDIKEATKGDFRTFCLSLCDAN